MDEDDGACKARAAHPALRREIEENGMSKSLHARTQRAQIGAEAEGQHGDRAIREVGGISTLLRLHIQRAAGPHVVGDIGDVDAQMPTILRALHTQRVVVILRIIGVNREDELTATILAACDLLFGQSPPLR